jgi:hypothetical protein
MAALRRAPSGLPTAMLLALLPAAVMLPTLLSAPAMSQTHDPARQTPGDCRQVVAEFVVRLREADRRLREAQNRPDAVRLQSSILAKTLAAPNTDAAPAELLACLTPQQVP